VRSRGIPVVFASGYELRSRPLAGVEGSVILAKPYTTERFQDALSAAVSEGRIAP
jgi:hypothetical protein